MDTRNRDISIAAPTSRSHPYHAVGVFMVAFVFAFIDRQVLNLLVEQIKHQFVLSDTELSLLQGLAFTGAYVACSPLIGRWVDRANRRNLLVAGILVWSACSALCGFAMSYWQLFAARAGVGAAEACLTPVVWSMLADYFDRDRLPRAMSMVSLGPHIGGGLALVAGGMVLGSAERLARGIAATDHIRLMADRVLRGFPAGHSCRAACAEHSRTCATELHRGWKR